MNKLILTMCYFDRCFVIYKNIGSFNYLCMQWQIQRWYIKYTAYYIKQKKRYEKCLCFVNDASIANGSTK